MTSSDYLVIALCCSWAFALVLIAWPDKKEKRP